MLPLVRRPVCHAFEPPDLWQTALMRRSVRYSIQSGRHPEFRGKLLESPAK